MEKEYQKWLINIEGIGYHIMRELMDTFGSAQGVYEASQDDLKAVEGMGPKRIQWLQHSKANLGKKSTAVEQWEREGIHTVTCFDKEFPERLLKLYDCPKQLFYKGILPDPNKISVAIVGARDCSFGGRENAMYFGKELAKAGIQVISGMARGIDSYAHQGALRTKEKGATFAVLGTGVDVCYPPSNDKIYNGIMQWGGVISEYPPGEQARAVNFPMRNRIISGLSHGIFIVEARHKSGSLITANMGLDQGKDIFALPGRVSDPHARGAMELIQAGANLVLSPQDIMEFYGISTQNMVKTLEDINILLETDEKIVYANLRCEPKYLDQIIKECGIQGAKVLQCLISLEYKGLCKQVTQNYFIRK